MAHLRARNSNFEECLLFLTSFQLPASVGYWLVLFIILHLGEHRPKTMGGGISLEEERFMEVSKSKYWGCHTFCLQDVEGLHSFRWKIHWLGLPFASLSFQKIIEWLGYPGVILNKVLEESSRTKNPLDLSIVCWGSHFHNAFKAVISRFHTLLRHFVSPGRQSNSGENDTLMA